MRSSNPKPNDAFDPKALVRFRETHKITQDGLAEILNVSKNYIWMIENGRKPGRKFIERFARLEAQFAGGDFLEPNNLDRVINRVLPEHRDQLRSEILELCSSQVEDYQELESRFFEEAKGLFAPGTQDQSAERVIAVIKQLKSRERVVQLASEILRHAGIDVPSTTPVAGLIKLLEK